MELFVEILKGVALLLISALIDVPFFRLSARVLKLRRLSFGTTYMLSLIVSGSLIVPNVIASPILDSLSSGLQLLVSAVLSLLVSGWVVGYFVTTEDRKSVGFLKGIKLAFLVNILFAVAVILLAVIFGGLLSVKP